MSTLFSAARFSRRSASATVLVIGFSINTCFPAIIHCSAIFAWVSVGVTIDTASQLFNKSLSESCALQLYSTAILLARSVSTSKIPEKEIALLLDRCFTWCWPKWPTPITPILEIKLAINNRGNYTSTL